MTYFRIGAVLFPVFYFLSFNCSSFMKLSVNTNVCINKITLIVILIHITILFYFVSNLPFHLLKNVSHFPCQSEYVREQDKRRGFISGFSGSAGMLRIACTYPVLDTR